MTRALDAPIARRAAILAVGAIVLAGGVTCTEHARNPAAPDKVSTPDARVTIEASRDTARMLIGTTLQLSSVVVNPQGHELPNKEHSYWMSSNPAIATVDTAGLVTAVDTGRAFVVAVHKKSADSVRVHVVPVPVAKVVVTPAAVTLDEGKSDTLTAATLDSIGGVLTGRTVEWSSSATNVATVDTAGIVAAQHEGTAWIRATSEGKSDSAKVTVQVPWTLTPSSLTLDPGGTATVTSKLGSSPLAVDWSISDASVTSVSPARGTTAYLQALKPGTATLTATIPGTISTRQTAIRVTGEPVYSVTIDPADVALIGSMGAFPLSRTLSAIARDREGNILANRTFVWASSDSSVAMLSAASPWNRSWLTATARKPGSAVITATSEGVTGRAQFTSLPVPSGPLTVRISPDTAYGVVEWAMDGDYLYAKAYDASGRQVVAPFTWVSLDPSIATITQFYPDGVRVVARRQGLARIVASLGTYADTAIAKISNSPVVRVTIGGGGELLLYGSGCDEVAGPVRYYAAAFDRYGNLVTDYYPGATWSASPPGIISVPPGPSSSIMVGASNPGTATLTATISGVSASTSVSPRSCTRFTMSPSQATIVAGQNAQLTATMTIDGRGTFLIPPSRPDVIWSSNNTSVAQVNQNGMVTAVSPGTATISVSANRSSATATITVTP